MKSDAARWLEALDGLIAAETIALRHADLAAAADVQSRAAPLIAAVGEAARIGGIPAVLLPQLRQISERRQENLNTLAALKALRRERLVQLEAARRRLITLKPAYSWRRPRSTFVAAV